MKKAIHIFLGLCLLAGLATGCTGKGQTTSASPAATTGKTEQAEQTTAALTEIEEDANILYTYCYRDAVALSGASTEDIKITKEGTKTTYTFTEHVLSCGTHMNGTITEVIEGNTKTLVGSFDVTENSYKINDLELDITFNTDTDEKTGYIKVNGKETDINSNFTWK